MKIKLLGSAAAEAVPAIWCECPLCQQARVLGGKDIRRRTSYLLDEDTLIDLGPDFASQLRDFRIDERKFRRVLITHRHEDHLSPVELFWRRRWFSDVRRKIKIFGGRHVFTRIAEVYGALDVGYDCAGDLQFDPMVLEPGQMVTDEDLDILPLAADHDYGHTALVYLLSRGGKKIFICNDSGALSEEAMRLCAGADVDLMIIDGTMVFARPEQDDGHLGAAAVLKQVERHRKNGTISAKTRLVVNHFTHNGKALHADLENYFRPHGIEPGYDGMEITV